MSSYSIFSSSFKTSMQNDITKIRNDAANQNDGNTSNTCVTAQEIKNSIADGTLSTQSGSVAAWQDVLNHFGQIDLTTNGRKQDGLINWNDISHFDLGTA